MLVVASPAPTATRPRRDALASLASWVDDRLVEHYGEPIWEPNDTPLQTLVGTILSQHTSDLNSSRAYRALTQRFESWEAVRDAPLEELVETIRSGGLAVLKGARLQALLTALTDDAGHVRLPNLRQLGPAQSLDLLTRLPGVGRKTAACVLLFGAHVPAMPVDTHVHRVALRLGLVPHRTTPAATADALEAELDPNRYYAVHVNLIRLGREICKAPRPRCGVCPLLARCPTGHALVKP
jgi:endonuclease III